jgi:hypothetical protein
VGDLVDSNGGKTQIAQPGWDARATTPAKRVSPDNSPRPSAGSDLDRMNRYMVVQDALRDGASIDVVLRDTNVRPCLGGPAPAPPSTGATTIANNTQSRRSVGRKRRCERTRMPSWWRRARVSSRRSVRVAWAARSVAPALKPPRIACRVPSGDASVNGFVWTGYWRATSRTRASRQ